MNTGQKVLQNTGFLSFGQVITIATGVVWTAIIARYIGPVLYGTYGYLLSILAILVLFINFGFENLTIRDVAQRPQLGWSYLFSILTIKLVLSVIVLGGFMVYVYWLGWKEDLVGIAIWATIAAFIGALISLTRSILYAREAMGYDTIAKMARSFLALASGYICVQMNFSFPTILAVLASTWAFQLFLNTYFVRKVLRVFPLYRTSFRQIIMFSKGLLRRSIPFFALLVVSVIYSNLPIILVKNLSSNPAEVGYYAAAQRVFILISVMPGMLFQAILPAFSRLYVENLEKMRNTFEVSYRLVFLITCPMAFGLWLVAPFVINIIYGADFATGGQVLHILSLSLINGVGWIMSGVLIAMDRQRVIVLLSVISIISISLIGLWIIPKWGAVAGAWAYNTGPLFGFIIYSVLTYRLLHIRYPFAWVIKVIFAAAVMAVVAWFLLPKINFIVISFLIAPVVYFGVLVLIRTFSKSDFNILKKLAPNFIAKFLDVKVHA